MNFVPIKLRRVDQEAPLVEEQDTTDEEADDLSNASDDSSNASESVSQKLFFCPEEGCIKSYQRYSSLHKHLEIGKHKRALERETLFDRAMLGYASRLEHGASAAPEIHDSELSPIS